MRTRWTALLIASLVVLAGVAVWVGSSAIVEEPARTPHTADRDFGASAVYIVGAGGALSPTPDARARAVWDEFARVVTPAFAATGIEQYRVGDNPGSDTLAFVSRGVDPDRWVFAANLAFTDDHDLLLATLVHEYAHIMSLGPDDVDPSATSCETVEMSEGCLRADSALTAFQREFWSAYTDAPAPDNDDTDVADAFFQAHEDDFVSDYAATNIAEDFAESFMTFVVEDRLVGNGAIVRKLSFFDSFTEYADARTRIRAEFGLG